MKGMRSQNALALTAGLSLCAIVACQDREVAALDLRQSGEQENQVEVYVERDIDILFVIDDSMSMLKEQDSLAINFERFIEVLSPMEGELPNIHIGVVSTDLGAGPNNIADCEGSGDNGLLQNGRGRDCGMDQRWIENIENADDGGEARKTNYSGSLTDTFSCIAKLGKEGCGFEQPLESMHRALNGSNANNAGFLRPDAKLAVIIITDEDDCSAKDLSLFDSTPSLNTANSPLGFLTSFRCFEFGVQCEPDTPRSLGQRANCIPRENSPYLYEVGEYVAFLRSLKSDPDDIFVAGIIGDTDDVRVKQEDGMPRLSTSCSNQSADAAPGIRLNAFISAFSNRSITTICDEDLSAPLTRIAENLALQFGDACLTGDVALNSGEPTCAVTDVVNGGKDSQVETVIVRCNDERSVVPCYYYKEDPINCNKSFQPSHQELLIERGDSKPPDGTKVVARCQLN